MCFNMSARRVKVLLHHQAQQATRFAPLGREEEGLEGDSVDWVEPMRSDTGTWGNPLTCGLEAFDFLDLEELGLVTGIVST
jgi:hypothetical protein